MDLYQQEGKAIPLQSQRTCEENDGYFPYQNPDIGKDLKKERRQAADLRALPTPFNKSTWYQHGWRLLKLGTGGSGVYDSCD